MAAVRNVMEVIRSTYGIINPRFDMTTRNIDTIYKESPDAYGMICNSFRFGYVQGMKAAKAEMKKKLQAQRG